MFDIFGFIKFWDHMGIIPNLNFTKFQKDNLFGKGIMEQCITVRAIISQNPFYKRLGSEGTLNRNPNHFA